ncbi:hypothetical protein [Desulfurobacterium sp. TC5-1]|uniref:hypothetical protein n=1 Tax=Desulfurobacterium sp. TC5-1 TaxID=1158318 RepID=UPI0003B4DE5F|nr:hypothetical protein [Desulfurobacterium sp. TC5-1]
MKFKEELLRIIMNGVLLLIAASTSIVYKMDKINPITAAIFSDVSAVILIITGYIIGKSIDKSDKK